MLPSFKPRLQNFRKIKYMQNIGNKEVASDLMESSFSYNTVIFNVLTHVYQAKFGLPVDAFIPEKE